MELVEIFWLALFVFLILIEFATVGLFTIWFAAGALIAGFLSLAKVHLVIQIIAFAAVAGLLLFVTRPLAARYLNSQTKKTNADSLIGEICLVTSPINNLKAEGQAVVKGQEWTARSIDGSLIPEGTKVRIVSISGVKLMVENIGE
jgi:membrane protein implicated in regulation of membrane protease activity